MKTRLFFKNAMILMAGSFLMRGLGVAFGAWLSGKLGAEGMGLFQLIATIYGMASTFATSGIYLSVTRLVAEEVAAGRYAGANDAMRKCMRYGIVMSMLAAAALFFFAEPISIRLLDDSRAVLSLRILAFALPFMALSSSLRGYFFALRKAGKSSSAQIVEQLCHMAVAGSAFTILLPKDLTWACAAAACGCVGGEFLSFLYTLLLYFRDRARWNFKRQTFPGITKRFARITIPVALSSYLKSALVTIENILIPRGFKKYGSSGSGALAQYGMTEAMVMPILAFPTAFLTSFSSLLVPEIAEARALGDQKRIDRLVSKVLRYTLLFAAAMTGIFLCFSTELGVAVYGREDVGYMLGLLAPLVPMLYLDNVADSMLKGLDEQVSVLRYSIADSALSIVLLYLLLPLYGVKGYVIVLFASTFVNATLSIARLAKVTSISIRPWLWIAKPAFCIVLAGMGISALSEFLPELSSGLDAVAKIVAALILYALLLFLSGSFTKEDFRWFGRVLRTEKPGPHGQEPTAQASPRTPEPKSQRPRQQPPAKHLRKQDLYCHWEPNTAPTPSGSQTERLPPFPVP